MRQASSFSPPALSRHRSWPRVWVPVLLEDAGLRMKIQSEMLGENHRMLGDDELGRSAGREGDEVGCDCDLQFCFSQALRGLHISHCWLFWSGELHRSIWIRGLHRPILVAHQWLFLPL